MNITTEAAQQILPVAALAMRHRKSTLPILGFVKLETLGDQLIATASSLEVTHSVTVRGEASKEWATCAPAESLFATLKGADCARIELSHTVRTNMLRIHAGKDGRRLSTLKCMPPEEFPRAIAEIEHQAKLEMDGTDLAHGLGMSARATSRDGTRFQLENVLFEIANEKLTFIGTDGYQVARNQLEFPAGHAARACWPRESALYVAGVLARVDDVVQANVGKTGTVFAWGESSITILHTDVDYPDVSAALPNPPYPFQATIALSAPAGWRDARKRAYLLPELTRARVIVKDRNAVQKAKLVFADGLLSITAETEVSDYAGDMDYEGDAIAEFVFDLNQLLPGLRSLRAETVTMSASGSMVRFDSVDDKSETFALTCLEG